MSLTLVSAPSGNVVSASSIYDHLRVDLVGSPAEPADAAYILALRDAAEGRLDGEGGILGRALLTQTWDLYLDRFPQGWGWQDPANPDSAITIPLPPLQSVTSISYVDTNGATQTLSSSLYQVVTNGTWPARIVAAYSQTFPDVREQPNAVTVQFVAGYGTADDVPTPIGQAIRQMVEGWYRNRATEVVGKAVSPLSHGVDALLEPYRVRGFG